MRVTHQITALGLAATLLGAGGVYLLAGLGWTLIFLAASSLGVAALLARGLRNG